MVASLILKVLELVAESRGPHAAREAMAAAELAPSKDSADLRVRWLRVACGCESACRGELDVRAWIDVRARVGARGELGSCRVMQ